MELIDGTIEAGLSPMQAMSGVLSETYSMSANLTVPQGGGGGTTTFEDTGNGNIVITSTTLTAHDNGGNVTIEG